MATIELAVLDLVAVATQGRDDAPAAPVDRKDVVADAVADQPIAVVGQFDRHGNVTALHNVLMALRRDTARLRAAASAVAADLAATLGGEWVCRVSDDYVLTLGDRGRAEEVLLDANVDEAAWPAEAFVGEYREPTLDDANEVVAEEVCEVLRAWDVMWPVCPAHGGVLTACSGVWVCGRTPSHDVAAVGSLGAVVGRRPDSGSGHS